MWEIFWKAWYFVIILPIIIFQEGNALLVKFLKKRDVYWDAWYSLLVLLILVLTVLLIAGYTYR